MCSPYTLHSYCAHGGFFGTAQISALTGRGFFPSPHRLKKHFECVTFSYSFCSLTSIANGKNLRHVHDLRLIRRAGCERCIVLPLSRHGPPPVSASPHPLGQGGAWLSMRLLANTEGNGAWEQPLSKSVHALST